MKEIGRGIDDYYGYSAEGKMIKKVINTGGWNATRLLNCIVGEEEGG